jgi:cytochrome c551/c552
MSMLLLHYFGQTSQTPLLWMGFDVNTAESLAQQYACIQVHVSK